MSNIATAPSRAKSSASKHSTSSSKASSKRFTREQLVRSLKIIGAIPAPLPPDLPPSPPASRSASPVPRHRKTNNHEHKGAVAVNTASSSKRKLDTDNRSDSESSRRVRSRHAPSASTSSAAIQHPRQKQIQQSMAVEASSPSSSRGDDTGTPNPSLTQAQTPSSSALASGSARASSAHTSTSIQHSNAVASSSSASPALTAGASGSTLPTPPLHMPIRRPRRGKDSLDYQSVHDHYHALGRKFKYSGEARFSSTFPSTHKHFKQLQKPPAPGSPYHTHGSIMSRLELIDALLCFVYAVWIKEYPKGRCEASSWASFESFMGWCKQKWTPEHTNGGREMAFVGLIHMIEAFVQQRQAVFAVSAASGHLKEVVDIAKLAQRNPQQQRDGAGGQARMSPPGMLPSPAGTASANSTPQNPGNNSPPTGDNTLNAAAGGNSSYRSPSVAPVSAAPSGSQWQTSPSNISVSMPSGLVTQVQTVFMSTYTAKTGMRSAQTNLSLPILREYFPRTFARMIYTTLGAYDEHEPDMEDDDGELFWPGQCVTGEGLGWVCLMGRSMVREFGREFGYEGEKGVVEKPGDGM